MVAPSPVPSQVNGRAPVVLPATVGVNARPWGHLYIDGRYIGETPVASVPVAPGRHQIRVVRPGFLPVDREIVVTAGEALRVTDIELRRELP